MNDSRQGNENSYRPEKPAGEVSSDNGRPSVKPRVALVTCPDYAPATVDGAIRRALDLLGGLALLNVAGKTVLVKPNVLSPKSPEEAVTTHPEVVAALCRQLAAAGARVQVGDSAGGSMAGRAPTVRALKVSGIGEAAAAAGAEVLNFESTGTIARPSPRGADLPEYHLARPALEADLVVSACKLKTHGLTILTGAVKNFFGCIPGLRKAHYHASAPTIEAFSNVLVDIYQLVRPGLAVMDAVYSMEGDGPSAGRPRHTGVILASLVPVAVDIVAAGLVGIDPVAVPTTRLAAARGLGPATLDDVEIVGMLLEEARPTFRAFALPHDVVLRLARSGRLPSFAMGAMISFLKTRPRANRSLCTGCEVCLQNCPVHAIAIPDRYPVVDYDQCIECLCCHELCPERAMELVHRNPLARTVLSIYGGSTQESRRPVKKSPSRQRGGEAH